MKVLLRASIFIILLTFAQAYSQWQPDVRLTNDPAASFVYYNWCVASSGNLVQVVWEDSRNGNVEIYNKRSSNGGLTWGNDTRLTNNPGDSYAPSAAISGSTVHVVWEDNRDGNYEIYYKHSTDGGISWGGDTRLTNNSASSGYASLSVSGSVVHVVWEDNRDGNIEVYYKHSTDGGISWGADTRLTNSPGQSYDPSLSVSGSAVHVTWSDNRVGGNEIYYKRSTDGGLSWGADMQLTNDTAARFNPSITSSGSNVHAVWEDNRDGNYEVYYKHSTDGGSSWSPDTRLTNNTALSYGPSISASGSAVHISWEDERDGNFEIYYKRSTNGGISWGADTRLTNDPGSSLYSSVSVSGTAVHVVWCDSRDGNYEVYYKRDTTGNPVGIIKTNSEIPKQFFLFQNYPNPFNPSTTITFDLPTQGNVKIAVYNMLGQVVQIVADEFKKAGSYEINFDALGLSSGVYFYKINSGEFTDVKKMIVVK